MAMDLRYSEDDIRTGPKEGAIKVLIVDDHRLFADAIRAHLQANGIEVVGTPANGRDALFEVRTKKPDVVLLDLGLPDEEGSQVGLKILSEFPEVKILIVTGLSDARTVREVMRAGFSGYLVKDTPLAQFLTSIQAVMAGQAVMPLRLASSATGARSKEQEDAALRAAQLTKREREVLQLLADGASSEHIANFLCVSSNTVRTHVQNVLSKLGVHSRLEAAAFAGRYRIVEAAEA